MVGVKKLPPNRFLLYIGRNSLAIYCLHFIFLPFMSKLLKVVPFLNSEQFIGQTFRSCLITFGVIILCIPIVEGINRYVPWTLGKT